MEQERVWTRMGRWFRRARLSGAGDLPNVGRDGLLEGVGPDHESGRDGAPPVRQLSRPLSRDQVLERLQDGHLKVVALVESIQSHMQAQERRAESMTGALEGIAGNMGRLSEAADRQNQTLSGIAVQLRNGHERSAQWGQAITEFSSLAQAQCTTLTTLNDQIVAEREADARIGESLDSVRGVLDSLERSNTTTSRALFQMQEASGRTQKSVNELILKQRAWLTRLVVVTLCVALAGIALGALALIR